MKISEKWLRSFVQSDDSIEELAERLTLRGLEVEDIVPVAPPLDGVVVAEILSAAKHPNADRLQVCQVTDGNQLWTIVCGAPNARAGIKVALAKIGTVLPQVTIKKSKIRDVESQGMLCSSSELGLSDLSQGIIELPLDAPVGQSIVDYLDLDDRVLDITITPNRGDCASVLGIAREIGKAHAPAYQGQSSVLPSMLPIYLNEKIVAIDPRAESPIWMRERLRRSGLRSLHVPVDVTNYIMLECGQPMHAFDAQKVQGHITVRFAYPSEEIELLNDRTLILDSDTLVIADHAGPIAIAGIMGGKRAAVSDSTTEIMLESAHFIPEHIARTARHYRLSSDSAYRFERGVDPLMPERALAQAVKLVIDIAGGERVDTLKPIIESATQVAFSLPSQIMLRYQKLEKVLGVHVATEDVKHYLRSLECEYEEREDGLLITPPSYRFDLNIEEDFIEEVLRFVGCHAIPAIAPHALLSAQAELVSTNLDAERLILKTRGYNEIISYSFVDAVLQNQLFPHQDALTLMNPISQEMGVMRTSLWTGLISTLMYNLNRQQTRLRLFEVGLCFHACDSQVKKIGGLSYGLVSPKSWANSKNVADFFDVKNDVEAIFLENGVTNIQYMSTASSVLHPTQSAQIRCGDQIIGEIGVLHPSLVQALQLPMAPVLFELDVALLKENRSIQRFVPLAKFPEVSRDLSFFVPCETQYHAISSCLYQVDYKRIKKISVFDVYQGKGVPEGHKSVAITLTIQDVSCTLTDEDVASLMKTVIDLLAREFKAILRD